MSKYGNYSGKLVVASGAYKITINSSLNSVTLTKTETTTYTPADNTQTQDSQFQVYSTTSGANTYFKNGSSNAAITAAGTYTLTSNGSTACQIKINIENPRTTVTWTSGVPKLVVEDLDAITGDNIYLEGNNIGWSQQSKYKFVYDAVTNSYNLNLPYGLEGQEFKIYDATTGKWYGKDKNGSYSTNVEVGTEITLYDDQSDNVWAYNWGTSAAVNINIKFSDTTGLKVLVTREQKWYVIGKQFDDNYAVSNKNYEMTPELKGGKQTGKFYYAMPGGIWNGEGDWFRFHDGTDQYGPADNTAFGSYGSKQSIQVQDSRNFRWTGAYEPAVIWLDATDKKIWVEQGKVNENLPSEVKYRGLTVMPSVVSNDRSKSWTAWSNDKPVVYIKGNYLNNNTFSPEWEMKDEGNGVYTLKNVTLRGNQNESAAAANKTIKAVVIYKDQAVPKEYTFTPTDVETASKLQYGYTYDLTLTLTNASNYSTVSGSLTGTRKDRAVPFMSLVGYNFQQPENGKTPRGKNTDKGWQEAWILYDENGDPMLDLDGEYIYNTQWPPRNPIQFVGKFTGADDIELSSDNLTFKQYEETEGTKLIKSGTDWKNYAPFQVKKYNGLTGKNLTNVFVTSATQNAPRREASASNGGLDNSTNYMRYLIENVWVLGSIKTWTGWGGQEVNSSTANWSGHANWGFKTDKEGGNFNDNSGLEIAKETSYQLVSFGGNMVFDQPTFFKTVELYIPVDANGVPTSASATPVFYTTLGLGDASIQARSATVNGASEPNSGSYAPMYDFEKLPSGVNVAGFRITRYDAAQVSSDKPSDTWRPAGKDAVVMERSNKQVTSGAWELDAFKTNYANKNGKLTLNWVTETKALEEGRYFYGLELLDADGNVIERVASNTFVIVDPNITPSVKGLQLLELVPEVKNDTYFNSAKYEFSWGGSSDKWYLTYDPDDVEPYFLVSGKDMMVYPISATDAKNVIDNYQVLWTTKYFVRAGNVDKYAARMASKKKSGAVKSCDVVPRYKLSYVENGTEEEVKNNELVTSDNGMVGYISSKTEGKLKPFTFKSVLEYDYVNGNNELKSGGGNAELATRPYMPGAYNLNYAYNDEQLYMGEDNVVTATLNTHSSVLVKSDDNAVIGELGAQGAPAAGNVEKTMTVSSIKPRNLRCIFEFDRPNVSEALTQNYDIYYDILFTNNDNGRSILSDRMFLDESTVNGKKCKVIANNVHPTSGTYPILAIKGTIYVPKGKYYDWNGTSGEFIDKPENPTEEQRRQIIAGLEKLRELTESDFNSRYQMYHTPVYSVETLATSEKETSEGSGIYEPDQTYRGLVLMCEGKNNTSYEKPSKVNFPISRFHNWAPGDIWYVNPASYGYRFTPNQENTPGNFTVADNGDVIHSWTDESNVEHSVYLKPQYYDIEAYVPGKVGTITYNKTAGKWEGTNYYDKGALFKVVTEGSDTYLIPDSDSADAFILANNFTVADDPVFIITPIYIFMRDPLMTGSTTTNDDYVGLVNFGANNHKQGDSQNAPAMGSAPRRAAGEGETINNGGTTTVNGKEIVVMRGGSATYAPASNQIFTEVQTIAAEPVDAEAEYYSLQGFRVVNPEAGQIYIVKRAGKVTRELVK